MVKNIFKKIKNSFSNIRGKDGHNKFKKHNNFKKEYEILNNKRQTIEFEGNHYDLNLINKETFNIHNLFETSNSKIKFYEDLLINLKIDKKQKILNLKYKLQGEKSIS
tara:strand:- start:243 stop:566 length:324 start_codon:yes stop_codon:yes gene_type:complete